MKKINILFLVFALLWVFECNALDNFRLIYPDFDQSLCRHGRSKPYYNRYFPNIDLASAPNYILEKEMLKAIYNLDKQKPIVATATNKIPKIIHQIWLGSPLPDKYKSWVDSWKRLEGWDYRLWTDEEVKHLTLYNSELYHAAPNYGEKADILRLELLYQFGGLYVDTDMQCLNGDFFEFANHEYSFYCGLEPLECIGPMEPRKFSCGNALMASAPGHPVTEMLITELASYANEHKYDGTVIKTGPRYMTYLILKFIHLLEPDGIIFPTTFFFPILGHEIKRLRLICKHESAAVHYFDGSWYHK